MKIKETRHCPYCDGERLLITRRTLNEYACMGCDSMAFTQDKIKIKKWVNVDDLLKEFNKIRIHCDKYDLSAEDYEGMITHQIIISLKKA